MRMFVKDVSRRIDNGNSGINSLSTLSIYDETSRLFQLEIPCFAIGHFYNRH